MNILTGFKAFYLWHYSWVLSILSFKVESPANTDNFNGIKIEIEVTKKIDQEDTTLAVEINVEKVVGHKIAKEDMEFTAMVIRWMYYEMRNGKYTPHAIFAKEFDEATEKFYCVNSWGNCEGYPKIHKSELESIYFISSKVLME